jgi:hypothetical protein
MMMMMMMINIGAFQKKIQGLEELEEMEGIWRWRWYNFYSCSKFIDIRTLHKLLPQLTTW